MATRLVRISQRAHEKATALARERHEPLGQVIEEALDGFENFERTRFLNELNAGFERLRADNASSTSYRDEVAVFDGALDDGLDGEVWDRKARRVKRA